jgi:hypothetical protein
MQEIAKELDLPIEVVDRMIHSFFTGVKKVMSNAVIDVPETFKTVHLTDCITFRPIKRKYIKDHWYRKWKNEHFKCFNKRKKKDEQSTTY